MRAATSWITVRLSTRYSALILALLFLLAWAPAAVLGQSAVDPTGPGSDGLTTATAFHITELGNLVWMQQRAAANQTTGKYYALMNDIDASPTATWNDAVTTTATLEGFLPIGNNAAPFLGIFEGQGYKITGLTIRRSATDYVGLFGSIGASGAVRDLGLENCDVTGMSYVGGLAGASSGAITSCTVTGAVASPGAVSGNQTLSYAGGLVGSNSGSIAGGHAAVTVTGIGQYVGGLAGTSSVGPITDSYSTGTVTGQSDAVGGLAGALSGASMTDCLATGAVTGTTGNIGGLVGNLAAGTLTNCTATGAVTSPNGNLGGLVGYSNTNGSVPGAISGCHASGQVTCTGQDPLVNNTVGGLVGVTTNNAAANTISHCYATGAVAAARGDAGGLVGSANGSITIRNSFATGATRTSDSGETGGLVGSIGPESSITNCFAAGPVMASGFCGGLVGMSVMGTISNAYSTGEVSGSNDVGGLIGSGFGNTVTSCYWDTQTSGQATSVAGTGKTTAEMEQQATFAGWDFGNVWGIVENESYPYFQTSPPPFHLTVTIQGAGTVSLSPDGGLYDAGTVVTLIASPAAGSVFIDWTGGVSDASSSTTTITMDGPKYVTALFRSVHEIRTLSELQAVATGDLNAPYLLMNDIDASDTANWNDASSDISALEGFQPIGTASAPFSGRFDGNGHKITGLTIVRSATDNVGLFGYIGQGAQIENLALEACAVTGQKHTGGLAGCNDGGTIANSSVAGSVAGSEEVGGLVGYAIDGGTATGSHVSGQVTASWGNLGGLVGYNSGATVSDCYATAQITGVCQIGGLVGLAEDSSTIANSYATGSVTGTGAMVGGLVGYNHSGTVSNCHAIGNVVSSYQNIAGLSGANGGTITNCYATGSVTSFDDEASAPDGNGGLVGSNYSSIAGSYAMGAVSSASSAGGLVGYNGGPIANSYATGAVTSTPPLYSSARFAGDAGGLVGDNGGPIANCYSTGVVTGSSANVGGLVGDNGTLGTVTACYWDTQASGLTTSDGGTGKTTAEMKQQGTYLPAGTAAGQWDFTAVWGIQSNYPFLRPLANHTLTYTAGANGSIDGAPSLSQIVNDGGRGVAVAAQPVTDYHFVQWSDGLTSNPRTDTNVVADVNVTASFSIFSYTLTYSAGPGGSLDGATSQTVAHGQSGTAVTANADAGWYFVDWSDGSTANPRTDANVSADIAATAHFRRYYEIRTLAELQSLAAGDLDGYYTLMNDIDASDTGSWNDAGTTSDTLEGFHAIGTLGSPFSGVFDGAGHRVVGLTCNASSGSLAGLFGCIGAGAAVHDIGLEGGSVASSDYVGALAAMNFGTITECYAAVEVTATGQYVGGLVGQNFGAISNSYAAGDVLGTANTVGGLVGSVAGGGSVDRCYATGQVTGGGAVGGLSGQTSGTVTNSYWDVDSTGQAASAGGTGESTAQMQQQATFQPAGGSGAGDWDFAAVWGISSDSGYPYLRAIETTATTREVIVRKWTIPRGQQGNVPVVLVSQGDENSLSFSVAFDAAKLIFEDALAGPDLPAGAGITKDMSHPGKVGLLVGLPSGEVFAAGNRDFVHLSFTAGSAPEDIALTFRNAPAVKGIGGTHGESLAARWVSGSVTVTDPLTGYEADVAPRPTGDGSLSAPDWTQMGRFVVGLDTPTTGSEFQRADCAPRATLGDGRLAATDWTQAGRYVVGSDPLTVAGGPTAPTAGAAGARELGKSAKTARSSATTGVSVGSQTVPSGQQITVPINLAAQGTENALTFSLSFDPSRLTYVSAARGAGVPAAATFTINEAEAAQGRLGVLIGNGTDSFAAGSAALMQITFAAATVSAEAVAQVQFSDTPALREVSDTAANALGTTWTDGSVTISPIPNQTGDFLSRRVRSLHSEKWDAKDARVVGKDAYSFSAKMQLPAGALASLTNATTLTIVLGDSVTSGAACEVFVRPLSAATKSTLAGHPTAKKPKDPTRGGSVTFVELQPGSAKKARVVTIKWTKTGLLTATVLGLPAPATWDPTNPSEHREVENVADLCDAVKWPAGATAGVTVPALVEITGVFADADTLTCAGKKSVKSSDGGDLVGWSVSGK